MIKRVLMLFCAFLLMLPAVVFFDVSVLAVSPSVSASYDANAMAVNVTGTGFVPGQSYVIRLMQRAPESVVGFINVVADVNGNIISSVNTGFLADGLFDLHVIPVGGAAAEPAEFVLPIGPPGMGNELVPLTARRNPQTGERLPFVLAVTFGFAALGVIALCYVYRSQLRERRIFKRFVARKKRLSDLLD